MLDTLPLAWAYYVTTVGFAVLLVIVWRIPRHSILRAASDQHSWRDIRWWASALIVIQLTVYWAF